MKRLLSLLAIAALAAALAAPALAATTVKHAKVDDDGFAFSPGKLTIKKGTKVVWKWVNGNDIQHNITVRKGPQKFHSALKSSGTFSHVFTKKGTYHLYCTIHSYMTETIVVK